MRHPMRGEGQKHRRRHRCEANRLEIAEVARDKFKALRIGHLVLGLRYKLDDVYTINLVPIKIKGAFAGR
jgi:hypothetical protein